MAHGWAAICSRRRRITSAMYNQRSHVKGRVEILPASGRAIYNPTLTRSHRDNQGWPSGTSGRMASAATRPRARRRGPVTCEGGAAGAQCQRQGGTHMQQPAGRFVPLPMRAAAGRAVPGAPGVARHTSMAAATRWPTQNSVGGRGRQASARAVGGKHGARADGCKWLAVVAAACAAAAATICKSRF